MFVIQTGLHPNWTSHLRSFPLHGGLIGLVVYVMYTMFVLSQEVTSIFWQDQEVFSILAENSLSVKRENECSRQI